MISGWWCNQNMKTECSMKICAMVEIIFVKFTSKFSVFQSLWCHWRQRIQLMVDWLRDIFSWCIFFRYWKFQFNWNTVYLCREKNEPRLKLDFVVNLRWANRWKWKKSHFLRAFFSSKTKQNRLPKKTHHFYWDSLFIASETTPLRNQNWMNLARVWRKNISSSFVCAILINNHFLTPLCRLIVSWIAGQKKKISSKLVAKDELNNCDKSTHQFK